MKKYVIAIAVLLLVGGVYLVNQEPEQVLGGLTKETIPDELKIKVNKDKILKAVDKEEIVCDIEGVCISKGMMKVYDYISTTKPESEYIFNEGSSFSQQRVAEKRPDNTVIVEISAKKRAYKDNKGDVFLVVHEATTTAEAYDLQIVSTPFDRALAFFTTQHALAAQDEYLSATSSTVWTKPAGVTTIDLLVVGGGGGAPVIDLGGQRPGGGGGGGVTERRSYDVSASSSYNVVVGAGGDVATGNPGGNSSFDATIIGYGGGAAGAGNVSGNNGGSGGGGSGGSSGGAGGSATQPTSGSGGNGNNGGAGYNSGTNGNRAGGGGGGAGGAASNAGLNSASAGGAGTTTSNYGTGVGVSGCFAGGGGGRSNAVEASGGCGAGQGSNDNLAVANAIDGTGGGGGGAQTPVGNGGDGAVIIKYTSTATESPNEFFMLFSFIDRPKHY